MSSTSENFSILPDAPSSYLLKSIIADWGEVSVCILVTFPVAVIKRLHKSSLKKEAFISQSVGIVLHGEKAHVAGP